MPSYLLYHMDPFSGHIERTEELHASDDVAAVHGLQRSEADHPRELWRSGRKVARIDALPPRSRGFPGPVNLRP
jgi:hypothetical protein